jgi:hypothetical protein
MEGKTMRSIFALLAILFFFGAPARAEEFLGAPVIPGGKVLDKTDSHLRLSLPLSHDEALRYYKEQFKDNRDIRFRDWKEESYIEDDGSFPWHSVRISKVEKSGTVVTITQDSWTWILGTLTLRFIGVFAVLMFLYAGMLVSGSILSRVVGKENPKKA